MSVLIKDKKTGKWANVAGGKNSGVSRADLDGVKEQLVEKIDDQDDKLEKSVADIYKKFNSLPAQVYLTKPLIDTNFTVEKDFVPSRSRGWQNIGDIYDILTDGDKAKIDKDKQYIICIEPCIASAQQGGLAVGEFGVIGFQCATRRFSDNVVVDYGFKPIYTLIGMEESAGFITLGKNNENLLQMFNGADLVDHTHSFEINVISGHFPENRKLFLGMKESGASIKKTGVYVHIYEV